MPRFPIAKRSSRKAHASPRWPSPGKRTPTVGAPVPSASVASTLTKQPASKAHVAPRWPCAGKQTSAGGAPVPSLASNLGRRSSTKAPAAARWSSAGQRSLAGGASNLHTFTPSQRRCFSELCSSRAALFRTKSTTISPSVSSKGSPHRRLLATTSSATATTRSGKLPELPPAPPSKTPLEVLKDVVLPPQFRADDVVPKPHCESSCDMCSKRFASKETLEIHINAQHSGDRPAEESEEAFKHRCSVCGDSFRDEKALSSHISKMPSEHNSMKGFREIEISPDELTSGFRFSHPEPILFQTLEHSTTIQAAESIQASRRIVGSQGSSPIHVGALARDDSPPSSYFTATKSSLGSVPLFTYFPTDSEAGEELRKLVVDMDFLTKNPGEYKLFFFGHYFTQFGPAWYGKTSVVVLFAKREDWDFASEHGIELDMHNNSVTYIDKESGKWHCATKAAVERSKLSQAGGADDSTPPESRPVRVVVGVTQGVDLSSNQFYIERVFRPLIYKQKQTMCPFCNIPIHSLQDHIRKFHEDKYFSCAQCGDKFSFLSTLIDHVAARHEDQRVDCPECPSYFNSRKNMLSHYQSMHTDIRFKCVDCNLVFKHRPSYYAHVKRVHRGERQQCDLCEKNFSTKHYLRAHIAVVHHDEVLRLNCTHCDSTFASDADIAFHRLAIHAGHPSGCDECSRYFFSRSGWNSHQAGHKKRHLCKECGKTYRTSTYLRQHQSDAHANTLKCPICLRIFTSASGLLHHTTEFHSDIEYECDQCNRTFRWKSSLDKHKHLMHGSRGELTPLEVLARGGYLTDEAKTKQRRVASMQSS